MKILKTLRFILINLILILTGFVFYYACNYNIIESTINSYYVEIWLIIGLFFLAFISYFFIENKVIKKYAPASSILIINIIVFLVFYVNTKIYQEGNFIKYKLDKVFELNNESYYKINSINSKLKFFIPLEDCLQVDTVEIRIDKGCLGMRFYSKNIRIVESNNCLLDSLKANFIDKGNELVLKRCFSEAFINYNKAITINETNEEAFYRRGVLFMHKRNFYSAIDDFKKGMNLAESSFSKNETDDLVAEDSQKIFNKLDSLNNENLKEVTSLFDEILIKERIGSYKKYIEYCTQKININDNNHHSSK